MKINDIELQEGPMNWIRSKMPSKAAPANPVRQEPTMDAPAATPTPDFSARLGNFAPLPAAKVTGPNKTVQTSQIPNTRPTVAPTNTTVYPAKTADTTQAILPASTATKTVVSPQTGTVPATNTTMPSNMGTYPVKPKQQSPASTATDTPAPADPDDAEEPTSSPTAANPFGAMVSNLKGEPGPELSQPVTNKSSTGGEITQSKTGLAHRAAANNPNQASSNNSKKDGPLTRLSNWYKAKQAGGAAASARSNSIQYQLEKWMGAAQGLDTTDITSYRDAMTRWAKNNLPQADAQVVQQSISTVDPNKQSTITRAIGDIYNSYMTNRAMDPRSVERANQVSDFEKELNNKKLQRSLVVSPAELASATSKDAADGITKNAAPAPKVTAAPRLLNPRMKELMTQLKGPEEPESQGTELDLDQLKAQRAAKQTQGQQDTGFANRGIAGLGNAAPAATAPATKVTTGGPTPDERAKLDQRIRQIQQRQAQATPVTESHINFGAMLFDRMKAGK